MVKFLDEYSKNCKLLRRMLNMLSFFFFFLDFLENIGNLCCYIVKLDRDSGVFENGNFHFHFGEV